MLDTAMDSIMSHGKLWAFVSAAVIVFALAASLFVVINAPFAAFGVTTWDAVFVGAAGCGIGSALASATACAIFA